jgi:hypothetical protein
LLSFGAESLVFHENLKIEIYRTIILPVVLYGCETWSLTLREESRLMVFESRVLRRIFGAKRDEVTGEWSECVCNIILNSRKWRFLATNEEQYIVIVI